MFLKTALGLIGQLGKTFLDGKIAKGKAKATAMENWDVAAQLNSNTSWKDEWFVILFSIPLVMCFIPPMVTYVEQGFIALEMMPDWYQYMLSAMVAASFGVKSVTGIMNKKKSNII
jgi:hypothetical protein